MLNEGQTYIITGDNIPGCLPRDVLGAIDDYDKQDIGGIKLTTHTAIRTSQSELAQHQRDCRASNIPFYVGGGMMEEAIENGSPYKLVQALQAADIDTIEISNPEGVDRKKFIEIAKRIRADFTTVLVEIGEKTNNIYSLEWWQRRLLDAEEIGADAIVLEGALSGDVGIYDRHGVPHRGLVDFIMKRAKTPIIIEAPYYEQQDHWIQIYGPNIALGNIYPDIEVIQNLAFLRAEAEFAEVEAEAEAEFASQQASLVSWLYYLSRLNIF